MLGKVQEPILGAERPGARAPAISWIALTLLVGGVWLLPSAGCRNRETHTGDAQRVIVLGFDGMDYELTRKLMSQGRMPNFVRLGERGSFLPLQTSIPPQSPVAWSDFITGMDAGGHGIYDFVHRDPETLLPYLSTSRAEGPSLVVKLGRWQIPLVSGSVELLRQGEPFWAVLRRHGIESTIIRMPVNFPPSGSASRELSGMGTPDLLGTYGTFSFYTSEPSSFEGREISGGRIFPVVLEQNVATAKLYGPEHPYRAQPERLTAEFRVFIDSDDDVAKLEVGDEERVLQVGEWSDWVPVEFELIPTQSLAGMARFYLKTVRPRFEFYVSPINLDPLRSALPISSPASYAAKLARSGGRFYTQGMPEDTKSLTQGVLDREEFLVQARLAGRENTVQYRSVLGDFEEGLLFYYFGNLDQVSHMMWRPMDREHPAYDPVEDGPFEGVVEGLYEEYDSLVGYTLERMAEGTTLIVMSDHGFTSWRRAFHLNAWLRREGYLSVKDPELEDDPGLFANVDWSRTRAYGLGLNSLYLNLRGRERFGVVRREKREALMDEIADKLLATLDPWSGEPAVTKVHQREVAYENRGALEKGPDLVIGYAQGVRCSDESALGEVGLEVFTDNAGEWSGDHCMDEESVPGVLLTSRPLKRPVSQLKQLAGAILAEFGIDSFPSAGGERL